MKEEEQVCTISKNPSTVTVVQYTVHARSCCSLFAAKIKKKKVKGRKTLLGTSGLASSDVSKYPVQVGCGEVRPM